jgi:hypothetical protein
MLGFRSQFGRGTTELIPSSKRTNPMRSALLLAATGCFVAVSAHASTTLLNENFDDGTNTTIQSLLSSNPASLPAGTVWSSTTNANAVNTRLGTDAINTYNAGNPYQRFSFASGTTFFNSAATNKFLVLGDDSGQLAGSPTAGTFAFAMPFTVAAGATSVNFNYDWVFKTFGMGGTDRFIAGVAGAGFNIASPFSLSYLLTDQSFNTEPLTGGVANGAAQGPAGISVSTSSLGAANANGQYYLVFALQEDVWQANAAVGIDNVVVTSVPEPETYAMFMAGLGLMGVITRRRKASNPL